MKPLLLLLTVFLISLKLSAQLDHDTKKLIHDNAKSLIDDLYSQNKNIVEVPCMDKRGLIVTNKALNNLMATKIASYLSDGGDLSLFSSYAILNSSNGNFSINQNFPTHASNCVRRLN